MSIEIRFKIFKDTVSAATHFVGAIAGIVGLIFLIVLSPVDSAKVTAISIYGGSLTALFLASSIYHFFDIGEKGNKFLRRMDHAAIFLLIAGTYMPVLIIILDGAWRITMVSVVGGLAVLGLLFKLVWFKAPSWLSVVIYLFLGWIIVIPGYLILPALSLGQISWLIGGGLSYSVGAIVYLLEKPDPWPKWFGHHEIWHIFVLVGALCHYFFVLMLLYYPRIPF